MIIREQYELLDRLGAGGMGEVWRARDLKLNRLVAIKCLLPGQNDPSATRRFLQEARAASILNHPNIITIHDVVTTAEGNYIVMELVSGQTLDETLGQSGALPPEQLQPIAIQIAEALAVAHEAGMVHRDLKPANVMVDRHGRVKILDFGLTQWHPPESLPGADPGATQAEPLTVRGSIIGTWPYMSPEQAQGKPLDARSDIFSFGILLYELATGRRPFTGDNGVSLLSSILKDVPTRISAITPGLSGQFEQMVNQCLEKEPAHRFASMHEIAARLRQMPILAGTTHQMPISGVAAPAAVAAAPAFAAPPASPGPLPANLAAANHPAANHPAGNPSVASPSRKGLWLALAAAGLLVATAGGWQLWRQSQRPSAQATAVPAPSSSSAPSSAAPSASASSAAPLSPKPSPLSPNAAASPISASPAVPPVSPTPLAPVVVPVRVPDGTPVALLLAQDLSAEAQPNENLAFTAATELRIGPNVVVAAKAAAAGVVAAREKKRQFLVAGKGTRLLVSFTGVRTASGQTLRLRATPKLEPGKPSTRELEEKGDRPKGIAARKGTPVVAYVDGAQEIRLRKATPAASAVDSKAVDATAEPQGL